MVSIEKLEKVRERKNSQPAPLSLSLLSLLASEEKEKATAGKGFTPPPVCSPNHISRLHRHPAVKQEERREWKRSTGKVCHPLCVFLCPPLLFFFFGRKLSRSLASLSQFLLLVGLLFGGLQNRGSAHTRSSQERRRDFGGGWKKSTQRGRRVERKDKVERGSSSAGRNQKEKKEEIEEKTKKAQRKTTNSKKERKQRRKETKGNEHHRTDKPPPSLSARECSCKLATPLERKEKSSLAVVFLIRSLTPRCLPAVRVSFFSKSSVPVLL